MRAEHPVSSPTISVVMATHNGELYLQEQLESLQEQIILPDELIVVDDDSEDRTLDTLRRFAARAPFPVTIIGKSSNLGVATSFFLGCSSAKGDLIALCDQDDVWRKDKLAVLKQLFEGPSQVNLATHALEARDEQMGYLGWNVTRAPAGSMPGPHQHEWASHDDVWGSAMMFRRAVFQHAWEGWLQLASGCSGRIGLTIGHDTVLWAVAVGLGGIRYCDAPLTYHRLHDGNVTCRATSPTPRLRRVAATVRTALVTDESTYGARAGDLEADAAILSRLCEALPERGRPRVAAKAKELQALAKRFRLRADIYQARRYTTRWALFVRAMAAGNYGARGFARWQSLIKDTAYCLVPRFWSGGTRPRQR